MAADEHPTRIESLVVGGLGAPPRPLLRRIVRRLSRAVAVPCRLSGEPFVDRLPMLAGREQGDADALLALLEARPALPGEVLLGVTSLDIGHPIFTHFFGRARRHGSAAVVSLARLTPRFYGLAEESELLVARATLELIHELGHLAGLPHCEDHRCIMRFCATVEAIDTRGSSFCAACDGAVRMATPQPRRDHQP